METQIAIIGKKDVTKHEQIFYLNVDVPFAQLLGLLYVQALGCEDNEHVESSVGKYSGTAQKKEEGVLITIKEPPRG